MESPTEIIYDFPFEATWENLLAEQRRLRIVIREAMTYNKKKEHKEAIEQYRKVCRQLQKTKRP
jgi:hypothetical protein